MRRMLTPLLGLIALLAATSCSYVTTDAPPALSFARYAPIIMDVGNVEFIEEYKSSGRPPYVEHLMPYSPTEAMRIWVKDRIRATGNESTLQIIIKDAKVMSTPLNTSTGLMTFMGLATDKRYDLTLAVEMRIYGRDSAMSESSLNVSTTRTITISDIVPVNERKARFINMVAEAMEALNAELEKNMFSYFGKHITYQ